MSFNGTGTFVINSSGQPVVSGTVASATVFNAFAADLATGLSTCITKDGQTTPTNNIPMGGFKITGLGAGTVGGDAVRLSQLQAGTAQLLTVSGTDTLTALGTPAVTAYTTGNLFYFVAAATNTTSVTLNVDGLGARNMTRHGSVALVAGDILVGEVCIVVYDGTRFQLLNPASYTNLNVSGVLSLAAGAVGTPSLAASGDLNTGIFFPAADTIAASVGGVEGWRLDSSGNLGIGTSSPGAYGKLAVVGTGDVGNFDTPSGATGLAFFENGTGRARIRTLNGSNGLAFLYGSTEGMRLDTSGNLSIGTSSPSQRLHVFGGNYRQNDATNSFGFEMQSGTGTSRLVTISGGSAFAIQSGNNGVDYLNLDGNGSVTIGSNVVATNATNGFLYVPTCAGVPTGTPTAKSGYAPIVVDTTNNRWYFYSGGAWRNAGP